MKLAPLAILIFIITSVLLFISKQSVAAADLLDAYVSTPMRRVMAAFGDLFPFSLFEIIILSLPIVAFFIIFRCVRVFKSGKGRVRFIANILAVALLLYSGNSIALGISYNTTSVDEKMGLSVPNITEDTLAEALSELCLDVNALSEQISYNTTSQSPYSLDEVSAILCDGFDLLNEEYGFPTSFDSRAKGVGAFNILSYLRLTGIYTYYTGEANVNTDYPDYDVIFTAAHEMSHQRGILRENEASFVGYLACMSTDDVYVRYAASLSMLDYIGTALWRTNSDRYYEIMETLNSGAVADLRSSYAVTAEYGDTFLADISEFVNDMFLKSNGTDGVVTYGRVVTLYMAYRDIR